MVIGFLGMLGFSFLLSFLTLFETDQALTARVQLAGQEGDFFAEFLMVIGVG